MSEGDGRVVSVFGAYEPAEGSPAYEQARSVGRRLAELGYAVANGAYGGTMEASARGAKEAGGTTIGVTCSIWQTRANRYIDRCVQTDSLTQRVAALLELGTGGYVALPGATGTLRELATAWETACLQPSGWRPIVCVGRYWRPLWDVMAAGRPGCEKAVSFVDRAEELVRFFPAATIG